MVCKRQAKCFSLIKSVSSYLYYIDDPDKLFSYEEYHYENHKGLLLFPVIFLPWILAGTALVLLSVDLSGF